MTDMTIPALPSTETEAPQVTTPNESTTPQAEKPAGTPQDNAPAGDEDKATQDAASDESPSQDDGEKKQTWKEKKAERNRKRWQEYKEAKAYRDQEVYRLRAEVDRLKSAKEPDYSQILDPNEEIAERTAWKVRQQQQAEAEQKLSETQQNAERETKARLDTAIDELLDYGRQSIPDFEAVALSRNLNVHENAVPFIVDSDKGAELLYYLGKNPAVADELYTAFASRSPSALIKLGRIEAQLSTPAAKPVSTAPAPAPIISGGINPVSFNAEKSGVDDMAAYLRKAGVIR